MSEQAAWQLSDDTAVAYERDFVPAIFAQWPPKLADDRRDRTGRPGARRRLRDRASWRVRPRPAWAPSGRVTGLDLNEGMLAVARRLRPEIDWRHGDALDLPFADHAFDVVVSQFALMFFPDRPRALREMWRVLAPGGRLAVAVCAPLEETRGYRRLRRHPAARSRRGRRGHGRGLLRLGRGGGAPAPRSGGGHRGSKHPDAARVGRASPRSRNSGASRSKARRSPGSWTTRPYASKS